MEVSILGGFAGFAGEPPCRSLSLNKVAGLWLAVLLRGRYSSGFCELFGRVFCTEQLLMTASICSFYNLKSFICDSVYSFVFLMFYFRVRLVNLIKSNKKHLLLKIVVFGLFFLFFFFLQRKSDISFCVYFFSQMSNTIRLILCSSWPLTLQYFVTQRSA